MNLWQEGATPLTHPLCIYSFCLPVCSESTVSTKFLPSFSSSLLVGPDHFLDDDTFSNDKWVTLSMRIQLSGLLTDESIIKSADRWLIRKGSLIDYTAWHGMILEKKKWSWNHLLKYENQTVVGRRQKNCCFFTNGSEL